jgi:hypothetical protein
MKVGSRKTEVDIPKLVLQPPLPASHLHYAGISPFYPLCRPPTCPTLASPPKGGEKADFFYCLGTKKEMMINEWWLTIYDWRFPCDLSLLISAFAKEVTDAGGRRIREYKIEYQIPPAWTANGRLARLPARQAVLAGMTQSGRLWFPHDKSGQALYI